MKYSLTILLLCATTLLAQAQGSWKILVNKKTIISTSVSDEDRNKKAVKSTDWKSNGFLEVSFKETKRSNWIHTLQFEDEAGNQMLSKDGLTAKIPLKTFSKLYREKKELKIYMVIAPPDPSMGAPVRRIHLGTLKLP